MNARLEQILTSIVDEKCLYINQSKTNQEENEAWARVGKKNKISANEVKTIFNCLVKKYKTEKVKSFSTWKLFDMMDNLHQSKEELNENNKEDAMEEDDAFVELLEVHDEGDYYSEEEEGSPNKSFNSATSTDNDTGETDELKVEETNGPPKPAVKILNTIPKSNAELKLPAKGNQLAANELKIATPAPTPTPTRNQNQSQTLCYKTTPNILKSTKHATSVSVQKQNTNENLKRKLINATQSNNMLPAKRQKSPEKNKLVSAAVPNSQSIQNKPSHAIKQTSVVSTTSQSSTPKLKEISQYPNLKKTKSPPNNLQTSNQSDVQDEKLSKSFETNGSPTQIIKSLVDTTKFNGVSLHNELDENSINSDIKNLDENNESSNNDNAVTKESCTSSDQLTPMLYKNLCNSKRYEAFGLYMCNIMNRLSPRVATNLEMQILKLVIDFTSEDVENTL